MFLFSDQNVEVTSAVTDEELMPILELNTVSTKRITVYLGNSLRLQIDRQVEQNQRSIIGSQDELEIQPEDSNGSRNRALSFIKLIADARKEFNPIDSKPYMEVLEEGTRQLYESREQNIQKLERMQEEFFQGMLNFTVNQQTKQQEFQRTLEEEYSARQSRLEESHQERLKELENREAELTRIRSELDERDNRQARRDTYREFKSELTARSLKFELTDGTVNRRRFPFWFTISLMIAQLAGFAYCFYKNVVDASSQTNIVSISSQIGFAVAFLGTATFFIRWNNQWFQRHAEEEFKLKRLELDMDRANWLVELAMEWENITKSSFPPELVEKLSRSLFITDETRDIDIHPAETILSSVFGKSGSVNLEFPAKIQMSRSEKTTRKKVTDK